MIVFSTWHVIGPTLEDPTYGIIHNYAGTGYIIPSGLTREQADRICAQHNAEYNKAIDDLQKIENLL